MVEGCGKEREKRKSTPVTHQANGTGNGNAISPFGDPPNEPDQVEDRSDEDEEDEDEDGASDGEGHEDDFGTTDSLPEGAAAAVERTEGVRPCLGRTCRPGAAGAGA